MPNDKVLAYIYYGVETLLVLAAIYFSFALIGRLFPSQHDRFVTRFGLKRNIVAGLLVWLPIIVTMWLIALIVDYSDKLIKLLPLRLQPAQFLGYEVPGYGIFIAIAILFLSGLFATNMLGGKVIGVWDRMLSHIPVVKSVYGGVKKISESLLSDSRQSFKTPILVQFPHPGCWTVAFVTGDVLSDAIPGEKPEDRIAVYVPTTPNPTSGYYIMARVEDTLPLSISVDDALKYVISLGMVAPGADGAGAEAGADKTGKAEQTEKNEKTGKPEAATKPGKAQGDGEGRSDQN